MALRRTVMACMLWESGFYESGVSVADRIKQLVPLCRPDFVAAVAYEARTRQKLRHAPLLLVREMARHEGHRNLVGKLLPDVIQRADELAEFVSLYWKDGKVPLSAQIKKGLAKAFGNFGEYALAKYDRAGAVRLRDVLFLCHAKPVNAEQDALWKRLINNQLTTPDTWEVELSGGGDKRITFERLMVEGKLGALAFLRNLRNMLEAGCSRDIIETYARLVDISRVLPFRFIAAARAVPAWEDLIEPMMLRACEGRERFHGHTVVLLDVSGSMASAVSSKSDIRRIDAAAGVAILMREVCERVSVVRFSTINGLVAPRRGFALRDAIGPAGGGTYLGRAVQSCNEMFPDYDRIVVLTDEQSSDVVGAPVLGARGYMINVATNTHGVATTGAWHKIDGWSESVIDYVMEHERATATAL